MKVSILIPVYNASKYLSVCLESVYNQTYSDVEVVIIDDGSVDNSLEIIKEYVNEKTIIISRENRGINQTRKELVLNSTGNILVFIDSDDYFNNLNVIENYISVFENYNCDMVTSNYTRGINGDIYETSESPASSGLQTSFEYLSKMISDNSCVALWNKAFKRSLLLSCVDNEFVDLKLGEDLLICMSYILNSDKIYKLDIDSILYREHESSLTKHKHARDYLELNRVLLSISKKITDEDLKDKFKLFQCYHVLQAIFCQISNKDDDYMELNDLVISMVKNNKVWQFDGFKHWKKYYLILLHFSPKLINHILIKSLRLAIKIKSIL